MRTHAYLTVFSCVMVHCVSRRVDTGGIAKRPSAVTAEKQPSDFAIQKRIRIFDSYEKSRCDQAATFILFNVLFQMSAAVFREIDHGVTTFAR